METNELIKALAADQQPPATGLSSVWRGAMALAVILAGGVFFATLGPRPDFPAAAESVRFLFKFVVTAALAASAFGLVRALSRPDGDWRRALGYLAAAPMLLAGGVIGELLAVPPEGWTTQLVGTNSLVCMTFIPLIGLGPLAVFLLALRHGAPTRPGLAGAASGLLAGGIAAMFYAAHCTDDSPLFVATWYTSAVALLSFAGAIGGGRVARW